MLYIILTILVLAVCAYLLWDAEHKHVHNQIESEKERQRRERINERKLIQAKQFLNERNKHEATVTSNRKM